MEIEILGTGCPKCGRLEKVTRDVVAEMGIEATITKVTRIEDILSYGIPATPGLVINGRVASYGRIPPRAELVSLIATGLSQAEL